jgi:hypothetical protein
MLTKRVFLTFMLALVMPQVGAQSAPAMIRGTLLDRTTQQPVAQAYVAIVREAAGWTVTDSAGRFVMHPRLRGPEVLMLTCPRPRGVWGATLDSVIVDIRDGMDTTITALVEAPLCDIPPYTERHGLFSGFVALGWEENRYYPLLESGGRALMHGGNPSGRHAEVSWSEAGLRQRLPWPRGDSLASSTCYQVRWVGTLSGPGIIDLPQSGVGIPSGVAAYRFVVDSTIAVALAPASRCTAN